MHKDVSCGIISENNNTLQQTVNIQDKCSYEVQMQSVSDISKPTRNHYRKFKLIMVDFFLANASYIFAWLILFGNLTNDEFLSTLLLSWGCFVIVFPVTFYVFGMYDSILRYAEAYEFFRCMIASIASAVAFFSITFSISTLSLMPKYIPISMYFFSAILAGVSTLFVRMAYRAYRSKRKRTTISEGLKKVLLVGAGYTGNAIIQELYREPNRRYEIVCIVDDDPDKFGRRIHGIKVSGGTKDIPNLSDKYDIDIIILAVPSASKADRERISKICSVTKCQIKKVPELYAFMTDTTSVISQIKDISIEDLLFRDVVDINLHNQVKSLAGKTILVTGAGGSIGSELCRQIAHLNPNCIVMLDINENGLYEIQQELLRFHSSTFELYAEIASIRDEVKLDLLFNRYKPDIVFHAAAHKHVPLMESAPEEAVKNNVFGTLNLSRCADKYSVFKFVMISTDKAVNPTSVMGATKRYCEMIVQCMNKDSSTEFVAVRFGNVLGSNGSFVPLFRKQISLGGPVTVTDKDVTRYFMTIPEAVGLVLAASEMAKGGEIFVLDMGAPVKIIDVAENLIRMSGLEPYKDIDIIFTGLRPGEKLHEELLMSEEGLQKTQNNQIFIGKPTEASLEDMLMHIDKMKYYAAENNSIELINSLQKVIPSFIQPNFEQQTS
ncbi:MAG: polysaccharide biosynthesis protein [Oscillospiraceae bacterium]|nr:polysaccharide biosynthesis protein [Oscillospiraceae bacterium]